MKMTKETKETKGKLLSGALPESSLLSLTSLFCLLHLIIKQQDHPMWSGLVCMIGIAYANNSTSDASEALIYAAASATFFAAYFTKIFVGFK